MQFINFFKYQAYRCEFLTLIIQVTTRCADLYRDGSVRSENRASMNKCDAICFSHFYAKQTIIVDQPEFSKNTTCRKPLMSAVALIGWLRMNMQMALGI